MEQPGPADYHQGDWLASGRSMNHLSRSSRIRSSLTFLVIAATLLQGTILAGDLSGAHWFCTMKLRYAGRLADVSATSECHDVGRTIESCCLASKAVPSTPSVVHDGGVQESQPSHPEDSDPSSDGCACCVRLISIPVDVPVMSLRLRLHSPLVLDAPLKANDCHAIEWVNSLLRPPSA